MGCDIHSRIELKKGKFWYLLHDTVFKDEFPGPGNLWTNIPWSTRNYEFFGILAGVRRIVKKPLVPLRGIPDSIIESHMSDEWIYDNLGDHSFSWITLDELRANRHVHQYIDEAADDLLELIRERECSDARIIFGFDN